MAASPGVSKIMFTVQWKLIHTRQFGLSKCKFPFGAGLRMNSVGCMTEIVHTFGNSEPHAQIILMEQVQCQRTRRGIIYMPTVHGDGRVLGSLSGTKPWNAVANYLTILSVCSVNWYNENRIFKAWNVEMQGLTMCTMVRTYVWYCTNLYIW